MELQLHDAINGRADDLAPSRAHWFIHASAKAKRTRSDQSVRSQPQPRVHSLTDSIVAPATPCCCCHQEPTVLVQL